MRHILTSLLFTVSIASYAELNCNDARYTYNTGVKQICDTVNAVIAKAKKDVGDRFLSLLQENTKQPAAAQSSASILSPSTPTPNAPSAAPAPSIQPTSIAPPSASPSTEPTPVPPESNASRYQ